GLVRSRIYRNFRGPFRLLIEATSPLYRTPEKGAETVLYLAASPALAGVTGRYFKDRREIEPTAAARDPALARQLWRESERLTHIQNLGGIGHEGAPSRVRGDG
ncbi:MAG TPA: short-chain dehydrogenase, partial [Bacteroidota bacterium]